MISLFNLLYANASEGYSLKASVMFVNTSRVRDVVEKLPFRYPASRGFSLAWLVCRVVGLFMPRKTPL